MGKAGKLLLMVTVLSVLVFAYAFISGQLSARLVSSEVESASERQQVFDTVAEALARGDLTVTQYRELSGTDPEHYAFVTYTVSLEGVNLLPAEWAVIGLTPSEGDVVLIQGSPQDMDSFGKATLTATLLTTRDMADQPHDLWVEYYVLGRSHTAAVRMDAA